MKQIRTILLILFLVQYPILLVSVAYAQETEEPEPTFCPTGQGIDTRFDPDCDDLVAPDDACPGEAGDAAHNGCPPPTPTPEVITSPTTGSSDPSLPDADGDGVPDVNDQCPLVGPNVANGCPDPASETTAPTTLVFDASSDQCLIVSRTRSRVNIRERAATSARRVGYLLSTQVALATDVLVTNSGTWYELEEGWVAAWVTRQSEGCQTLVSSATDT